MLGESLSIDIAVKASDLNQTQVAYQLIRTDPELTLLSIAILAFAYLVIRLKSSKYKKSLPN